MCIKYNGAKESYDHEYLKNTIARILENSKTPPLKVEVEKIVRNSIISKEWRKPDIRAEYTNKELVFELQLSSTFVDIIIERAAFYKERKSFLIWIFDEFSTELKNQTFSQTDILVSSNYNVFVFDKEMEILSKQKNELYLKCYFIQYSTLKGTLSSKWNSEIISLEQLQYDEDYQVYFHNTITEQRKLLEEIEKK